jgi:ribonuclease MRP protein subunit SNM1
MFAATTTTSLPDQTSASKAADNASSKKRAKARKQGGLQALMAAKQTLTEPSQSLDLFDFLQQ